MSDEELGFTFRYKQIGETQIAKTHKNMLTDFRFIQEALMGPVGVAAGLALAGSKLIAFGEANATTKAQKEAFEGFRVAVDGASSSLGEATAEALASSGALDAAGRGVELLAEEVGSLLNVLRPLGPLLDVVMLGVEAMMLPIRGLGAAIEFAADVAEPFTTAISDAGEEAADAVLSFVGLDDAITTTAEAASQGRLLVDAMADSLSKLREQADWYARLNKERDKEEREATAARISDEAKVAEARAIALRGGMDAILAEDKLQAALVTANKQYDERLTRLRELEAIDPDKLLGYMAEGTEWSQHMDALNAAQLQFNVAQDSAIDIQAALDEVEKRRGGTKRDNAKATHEEAKELEGYYDVMRAIYDITVQDGPAYLEWWREYMRLQAGVAEARDRMVKQQASLDSVFKRAASDMKRAAADADVLLRTNDAQLEQEKLKQESYMATARAAWEGTQQVVKAAAAPRWVNAVLGLGEEIALAGMAFASGNVAEGVAHTANLAAWVAQQAAAESFGGGSGSAPSGAAASSATAAASAGVPSELDSRQSGDRSTSQTVILQMDRREWGRGVIDLANGAERSGKRLSPGLMGGRRNGWVD